MVGSLKNSSWFRVASSMSSFDRRTFLISAIALAGCGFTPAYGPGGVGTALRNKVRIAAPDTAESFALANELTLSFGPATSPLYEISYEIQTTENQIGLTQDQEILRYHVEGSALYKLTSLSDGRVISSGKAASFTGYSVTSSAVDRLTASRDAYARLMKILSDQIVSRVLATADLSTKSPT